MAIQSIIKGSPDWQEPINQLIKDWNDMFGGGNTGSLRLQSANYDVVQSLNGVPAFGREGNVDCIFWAQFPGWKIVNVQIDNSFTQDVAKTIDFNTAIGQIPQSLAPIETVVGSSDPTNATFSEITSDGKLWAATKSGEVPGNYTGFTRWYMTYLHKD